jgi:hypothetical protein
MVIQHYSLEQFQQYELNGGKFQVSVEIRELIDSVNKQIVPIVLDKNEHEKYKKTIPQPRKQRPSGTKAQEDQSWERIREFRATPVITALSGPEKLIQDVRSALNKMSSKNYEVQKDQIITLLRNNVGEINADVSKTIFDIASTNRFYAEIYAKLYKELIAQFPIFTDLLNNFIVAFVNNVREIEHVDGDKDYELFCAYNKRNDMRKAMTVFLVYLMKEEVLSKIRIINIILIFQELTTKYLDEPNKVNEVDEITEVLFLFFQEGKDRFQDIQTEWIWKFKVVPLVQQISKYKKNNKPSISSRTIFKYMDMIELLNLE